ncbi:MAG: hypothetical protein SGJ18_06480 [Pseudomonadota bacterium]|nr:hypothetical protein [Pseudomonadota bacterium]
MQEQELLVSSVPRALEMKSKIFGFETPDLLIIFLNMTLMNLVFGTTSFRYPLVWGTTLSLALFLFFAKRGKPDNYLQHLGEYISQDAHKVAGGRDLKYRKFMKGQI